MNSKIAYPICAFLRAEKIHTKKNKYGREYKEKLQTIYYPSKRNLVKTLLIFLENDEVPTKAFLAEYEKIFSQFPNKSCRNRGIHMILTHIGLWIHYGDKYDEKSKKFLFQHCTRIVQKYEPKLKICRENLRRTVLNTLAEQRTPSEEDVEKLTNELQNVSKTFDHEKNAAFSQVFKEMKKVLKFISIWSVEKENGGKKQLNEKGKKIVMKTTEKMYQALEYDCWNLRPCDEDVSINAVQIVENIGTEVETNVLEKIFENKSNRYVKDIIDGEKPVLDRVTSLAKKIDIEEVNVLIRLAGLAEFRTKDVEIKENLCLILQELLYRWETDPDVLEKILADKQW